jgi:hypothetical protein
LYVCGEGEVVAQPPPSRIAAIREMIVIMKEYLFGLSMVLPPEWE